ncbi:putative methyltransferase BTM2 [Operophtera brumata]|uniref:S-adenosylmethionine sensor upstream of mTORC1 n=1 Tax=Operophtera brumata TaxID=104452 RepID=A0A0L7L7R9_OPEBR|nr:putative methyltransferase BTM2 [Operophtera brumata]
MANQDHQSLTQYIKGVHSSLRKTTSELGAEKAWYEHCKNHDILLKYADYMQRLATTHWENNCASESSEASSRIEWTAKYCTHYFINQEYVTYREKEQAIASKLNLNLEIKEIFSEPLKIIDVGSCYNPFRRYENFDVLAIDLCPANDSVLQCDFLSVLIGTQTTIEGSKVVQLQHKSSDIVTFCFLLEYIPSSDLRISACERAYSLLRPGGLLIINTPDSKHVGANSKLMKCWRYTLAQIGFNRIKYEKFKHMHCMAFRKSLHKDIAARWAKLHEEPFMKFAIQIPQDFKNYETKNKDEQRQCFSSVV